MTGSKEIRLVTPAATRQREFFNGVVKLPIVGTPQDKGVRFTIIDTDLVEALSGGGVEVKEKIQESHSAPWFNGINVTLSNPRPNADGSKLVADVSVVGQLRSKLSDLVPFEAGIISSARLSVNGGDTISIPVQFLKDNPLPIGVIAAASASQPDLARPYAYSGTINWQSEIEISTGHNWFRVEASDNVPNSGLTGFAEFTAKISAEPSASASQPPPGQPPGPYHGFLYANTSMLPLTASGPGELHAYLVRMKGPPTVLSYLASRPGSKLVSDGGNSSFYAADSYQRPAAHVAMITGHLREINFFAPSQFAAGFAKGFVYEGVGIVVGTAQFAWSGVTLISAAVVIDVGIDADWATQRLISFDTDFTQFREMSGTVFIRAT